MIELVPLAASEFDAFFETVVVQYADDAVRGERTTPDLAHAFARGEIGRLLASGKDTPGHSFLHIRTRVEDAREPVNVGYIWYADTPEKPGTAHLYYIIVREESRGRGFGSAALETLLNVLARQGSRELGLHVFAANSGALRLYERLGLRPAITTCARHCKPALVLALQSLNTPANSRPAWPMPPNRLCMYWPRTPALK